MRLFHIFILTVGLFSCAPFVIPKDNCEQLSEWSTVMNVEEPFFDAQHCVELGPVSGNSGVESFSRWEAVHGSKQCAMLDAKRATFAKRGNLLVRKVSGIPHIWVDGSPYGQQYYFDGIAYKCEVHDQ